jgi:hypothetical protein
LAGTTIFTWVVSAIVDVVLTQVTFKTGPTAAAKGVDPVDTVREVQAWVRVAVIDVDFAVAASETRWAGACISGHTVRTHTAIEARV